MAISPARVAAYDVLLRVDQQHAFASEMLHAPQLSKLSAIDHGLATELTMGVLRWRSLLDHWISEESSLKFSKIDVEVLTSLRIGCYQLSFLDRVPERAAINDSVELVKRARKRSAAAFVNALLRKLIGRTQPNASSLIVGSRNVSELATCSAHPEWLVQRWADEYGFEIVKRICESDQRIPETSLAVLDPSIKNELENQGIPTKHSELLHSSLRAEDREVSKLLATHKVAIQDEASQLVALLVGQGSRILDCCAAPGGKTRMLANRNPAGTILAVELHPRRARLLRNLVSAGNVQVVAADARALPGGEFDAVLADVPCSGTGTLGRNPEIKWKLVPEDLNDLQGRQIAILRSAMEQVASGGRVIYSTCSLEKEENEDVVNAAASDSFRVIDIRERLKDLRDQGELAWNEIESLARGPYLRTIPGVHPCDGFFAAILQRPS